MGEHVLKDSGERREFSTGAVRDRAAGKGRFDLISPIMLRRLALVMEKGAQKYSARNWERGMPLSCAVDSAIRHGEDFLEGKRDEDHAAQAIFNWMLVIHGLEMIERGLWPAEMNDLPCYIPPNPKLQDAAEAQTNVPTKIPGDVCHMPGCGKAGKKWADLDSPAPIICPHHERVYKEIRANSPQEVAMLVDMGWRRTFGAEAGEYIRLGGSDGSASS